MLGKYGFFYAKQLSEDIERQQTVITQLRTALGNLQREEESVYTEEFLKDNAIRLGYSLEGDIVYYFEPDDMDYVNGKMYDFRQIDFSRSKVWYMSAPAILLVSAVLAGALTLLVALEGKRESGQKDGTEQEQS
ncbi:MAG: hypothetical protein J5785_00565 [Spirochaetales bacterium]|nr:hypothetical protein [Spirochaetales bacterium]